MPLSDVVHTFGQWLLARYGQRVHKIALDAGFTCPNRDGSKGVGGCTFCNNASFSPGARLHKSLDEQMQSGKKGVGRCTGAEKYLAYFQAYTNTYADVEELRKLYDQALAYPGVIGLAVGTRPDCVPPAVLDLLEGYRDRGHEVWLELGLQSAFDESLARVNRGHGFAEYVTTCRAARQRGLPVCTHLILGLPGETAWHGRETLNRVLDVGTDGLKLHPLHVVKHTLLAHQWRLGEYSPMAMDDYIRLAADLIERTPECITYHRVTGTAPADVLLAPAWCQQKWAVLNGIENELKRRKTRQGSCVGTINRDIRYAA
ncbi:MAG: TIGR01212 family radical SAM protein [Hydrogenophilales bacterium CG03_land_8_20_14_0_80_62_28]|nr:MAG: TIGR01212 family radical SAM protein [Hydrogenophilales bacterium CG03_land_8_20_14_0_80_62_28]